MNHSESRVASYRNDMNVLAKEAKQRLRCPLTLKNAQKRLWIIQQKINLKLNNLLEQ